MVGQDELGARLPKLGPKGEGWVVLQFVMLALVWGGLRFHAWAGLSGQVTFVIGDILVILGAVLLAAALLRLGPSLTPNPYPKAEAKLVERGIYAWVRHPIYGGLILGCLGASLARASFASLIATGAVAVVLTLKSLREEAWLVVRYEGYADYRKRTKRFFPGLF
jgi:protein-S-isoprenylcysteine O-methyltransferase Ste14